jgi:hypothetical protein
MLNIIVEALAVSFLLEVALDLALVGFNLRISHLRESSISFRLSLHDFLV